MVIIWCPRRPLQCINLMKMEYYCTLSNLLWKANYDLCWIKIPRIIKEKNTQKGVTVMSLIEYILSCIKKKLRHLVFEES